MSGQLVDTFSIKDFENSLLETFRTENKLNLPKDQMTVTLDGKAYSVKIYLRSISILNPTYITPKKPINIYISADGYALVKRK